MVGHLPLRLTEHVFEEGLAEINIEVPVIYEGFSDESAEEEEVIEMIRNERG